MDKELNNGLMVINMMECGKMIWEMGKASCSLMMEVNIVDFGKKINFVEKV